MSSSAGGRRWEGGSPCLCSGGGLFPDVACLQRESHVQVFHAGQGWLLHSSQHCGLHSMHVLPMLGEGLFPEGLFPEGLFPEGLFPDFNSSVFRLSSGHSHWLVKLERAIVARKVAL